MGNGALMHLMLLVGSNPLPNFIVAKILQPSRVSLLYTDETRPFKDALRKCIFESVPGAYIHDELVGNATLVSSVQDAFREAVVAAGGPKDLHLNYTGGTKVMAVHTRAAFREMGCPDSHASYFDDREGKLRFDDGTPQTVRTTFTLDDAFALHVIKRKREKSTAPDPAGRPTDEDAARLSAVALHDPSSAANWYTLFRKLMKGEGKEKHLQDEQRNLARGLGFHPDAWSTDSLRRSWARFLCGTWLDRWTGAVIGSLIKGAAIETSVECVRDGRDFEIDVSVIQDHRMHMISCTTDTDCHGHNASETWLNKNKLFEAAIRARQMAGDLARPALVTLLEDDRVDLVRNDMKAIWSSHVEPRVFGLENLREWQAGKTTELTKWLAK